MRHTNRRFYSLPCWVFFVDGERVCVCSNDRQGAEEGALLSWRKRNGNRSPKAVELKAIA